MTDKNKANQIALLTMSAEDLTKKLGRDIGLLQVKQMAYEYYNSGTNEFFQVQIIVTRDSKEFLDTFITEETIEFGK